MQNLDRSVRCQKTKFRNNLTLNLFTNPTTVVHVNENRGYEIQFKRKSSYTNMIFFNNRNRKFSSYTWCLIKTEFRKFSTILKPSFVNWVFIKIELTQLSFGAQRIPAIPLVALPYTDPHSSSCTTIPLPPSPEKLYHHPSSSKSINQLTNLPIPHVFSY